MKKLFLTSLLTVVSMVASAQFYAGGGVGLGVQYAGDTQVDFFVTPEVGYYFNKNFALGVMGKLGCDYQSKKEKTVGLYAAELYGRYDFLHKGKFALGAELGLGYADAPFDDSALFTLALRPVARYNVWKKLDIVGRLDVFRYEKGKDYNAVNFFAGSGTTFEFGVQWNF